MKLKQILFAIIMSLLCVGIANSQIIPRTQKLSLTENDKEILDQHISKYTVFTMDKQELITNLYANSKTKFRLQIDEELDWVLNLELNDMRSPDYKQVYTTSEGEFEVNRQFVVNTFKGYTSDGQVALFSIDDNTFFGVIFVFLTILIECQVER